PGIAIERDMRCDCAGCRDGICYVITAMRTPGHVCEGIAVESAVSESEVRESVRAADGMTEHIPPSISHEDIGGRRAGCKAVVPADSVITNISPGIANKKIGRIRGSYQNVVGTSLMIN